MFNPLSIIKKLRGVRHFIRLVNDPNRLDEVFNLSDSTESHEILMRTAARFELFPKGAAALRERRRMPKIVLQDLAKLPEGTFGRVFADFMITRGLDPASIPTLKAGDPAEYIRAHLYESHDIWHVVTGFGTDVAGELGLQGFYMAQIHGPLPPAILSAGLLNAAFHHVEDFDVRMRNITAGWRLGKRSEPFFGTYWDQLWTQSLEDVRRLHGIDPRGIQPELEQEAMIMTGLGGREAYEKSQLAALAAKKPVLKSAALLQVQTG